MQSQNGWPYLAPDSGKLHTWVIPSRTGEFTLRMRNGSAGFVLAVFALWFSEVVQQVRGKILDDWGYASRDIRGSTVVSNHASGTAMDLNARAHGLGIRDTFSDRHERWIHKRLRANKGVIRWGGDYVNRADEMHFEIVQGLAATERQARALMLTSRGLRVLKANPGQRRIINS